MATEMNIDLAIRYLKATVNEADKEQFERWLNESEENALLFNDYKKYWEITRAAYQNYEPDKQKGWKAINQRTIHPVKVRAIAYRLLKIAASVLLLISLGFATRLIYNCTQKEEMVIFNSSNSIVSFSLPDSSKVWLNAHSELKVPKEFKGRKRNVWLKGEAFFEVTKNYKKPFRIYAYSTTTEVLGTSFNLSAGIHDSTVSLTVVTGKVAFSDNRIRNKKLILLPGQGAKIDLPTGKMSEEKNRNINFLAWKTRKLQFKNTSLPELCCTLSDFYNISIIPASSLSNRHFSFSGHFENAPLNEALNIIELTLGVRFVKSGKIIIVQ
jgi:transmembrane sensor